jgi:RNA polymerase sigma-70 factor (ECF subfamily)
VSEIPEEMLAAVFRFALRLTRDHHRAEDLTQDVFVRVWPKWLRPRQERPLRTYLFRTAVRRWRDLNRRRPMAPLDDADAEGAGPSAERTADAREELAGVLARLDRLPEKQRLALHLVGVEGLTIEEAAGALGSTVAAVKANVSLARARLRETSPGLAVAPDSETDRE